MIDLFKRNSKWSIGVVIIAVLLVIGIITGIKQAAMSLLLPVIIIGGIFLLYKFPPAALRGSRGGSRQQQTRVIPGRAASPKSRQSRPKSKTVPFRVIEGGKDDDDTPPEGRPTEY